MTSPFVIAVVVAIMSGAAFVISILQAWNIYRHPNLKPHPVIKIKEASAHGFKWMRIGPVISSIIPPTRTEEGAIWSGFSLGVSRENGKVATIGIVIYGAEQGVGHYTWRARTDKHSSEVGAGGHFNLDRLTGEEQPRRESRILRYAVDQASDGVNTYYRPLQFSVEDEETISTYDPESGRMVFPNPQRDDNGRLVGDFFIFGPPPMGSLTVPYARQPGAYVNESSLLQEGVKQLTFKAWDVYEQPLDYVQIEVASDSGYRYTQALNAEHTNEGGITITLPYPLTRVRLSVTRGGFHPITEDLILKDGIQQVGIFMKPRLFR